MLSTLDTVQDEAVRALAARDEVRATDGNGLTRDLAIEFRDDNGSGDAMISSPSRSNAYSKARFRLAALSDGGQNKLILGAWRAA